MTAHGTTTEDKAGATATIGFSERIKTLLLQMICTNIYQDSFGYRRNWIEIWPLGGGGVGVGGGRWVVKLHYAIYWPQAPYMSLQRVTYAIYALTYMWYMGLKFNINIYYMGKIFCNISYLKQREIFHYINKQYINPNSRVPCTAYLWWTMTNNWGSVIIHLKFSLM